MLVEKFVRSVQEAMISSSNPKNSQDSQNSQNALSRRNWLGLLSAATLGSGLPAPARASADSHASLADGDNTLGTRTYNLCDFGAKGDGKTLDTAALQAAIDTCHKDRGGTVLVPAGVFVIG